MRFLARCLPIVVAALAGGGCGREGDVTSTARNQPVRIVSGVDGRPVAGARVFIEGGEGPDLSNASGELFPSDYLLATYGVADGAGIDVDAAGFLPRRTRLPSDRVVTLWPVADDIEAGAVRRMVYGPGGAFGDVRHPPDSGPFRVHLSTQAYPHSGVWSSEATGFGARFAISYRLTLDTWYFGEPLDRNAIAVFFGPTACDLAAAWGFCRELSESNVFTVKPERAGDPRTIRRVLASWFLGPNPLPGLMSVDAPADDLSPLEVQTIRMILLRRLPNRWPDTDR